MSEETQKHMEKIEEVLFDLLHPSARWLLDNGVHDLVDLEAFVLSTNRVKSDPVGVVSDLTELLTVLTQASARVSEARETTGQLRDRCFDRGVLEVQAKDSVAQKEAGKFTQKFCDAWVRQKDVYQLYDDKYQRAKLVAERIDDLIEVVKLQYQAITALIQNLPEIPDTSGTISPRQAREEIAKLKLNLT